MNKNLFLLLLVIVLLGGFFVLSFLLPGNKIKVANEETNNLFKKINSEDQQNILNSQTSPKVTLIAVGDIMLSRDVASTMKRHNDYKYPFLKTADLLKTADITFGNLECAITPGKIIETNEMIFRADPQSVEGLNYAGFDILSLANNHTMNFGKEGIENTFKYLNESNIKFVGAGNNLKEAFEPKIFEVNGLKIAFLAYADNYLVPASYQATENKPGIAFMNISKMQEDVKATKEKANFVIVSMHAGVEYSKEPNKNQINFAYNAIDAGADLVIGHHPHMVQKVEKYKNKYILYSLGNFVFDQMWSMETREGIIAKITFDKNGIKDIEFVPVLIENYSQPKILDEKDPKSAEILLKLQMNF